MNKPTQPLTVEAAIHAFLAEFSEDEIKHVTGKSYSLVSKWANDECESNYIPFHQAVNCAAALKRKGLQERFTEAFKTAVHRKVTLLGGIPAHCPADPSDRLTELFVEAGDVAREIQNAINPSGPGGRGYTQAEISSIAKEAYELRDAVDALLKDIGEPV